MLHVNYNQCRLLLILFGDIPHTIIKFPENALFGLGTHNLSFLVHVIVLLHLVCTSILVSNDATRNFVCILICSQEFSSYLQLVHSAFAVCKSRVFSISSGGGKYRVLVVKSPTVSSQYLPLVFLNFAVLAPYV